MKLGVQQPVQFKEAKLGRVDKAGGVLDLTDI